MSNLVSTEWLAAHLRDVRVVDASWYMPDQKREPAKEFEAGHIPGAVFFDVDAIADRFAKLIWPRQHVRQIGRVIGDRVDVEEHRAGNMAADILGARVAVLAR